MENLFKDFENTSFGPLKYFYAGKILQHLSSIEEKNKKDEEMEKILSQYLEKKEFASSLSIKIQKLLVEFPKKLIKERQSNKKKLEEILIEPEMIIDWKKLSEEKLEEWSLNHPQEENFTTTIEENQDELINQKMRRKGFFLCDIAMSVDEQLCKVERSDFVGKLFNQKVRKIFDPATKTLKKEEKEFTKKFYEGDNLWNFVYDCYHSQDTCEQIFCFQLCVSLLERGLGTVFNLITKEKPPHTTRELLEKEIFIQIFGEHKRQLIQSLIGHPEGLNLRNVLWHGFISSNEFLVRPFLSLLLCFFLSITKILEDFTFEDKKIVFKERFMKNISFFDDNLSDFGLGKLVFSENLLDLQTIKKLMNGNYFLVIGHQDQFLKSINYYNQGNYFASLSLILPIFEHCLRIIFCSVNKLEERYSHFLIFNLFNFFFFFLFLFLF
jgi:hypothetical protein